MFRSKRCRLEKFGVLENAFSEGTILLTATNRERKRGAPRFLFKENMERQRERGSGDFKNEFWLGANDRILAWHGFIQVLQTAQHVTKGFYQKCSQESSVSRYY